MTEQWLIEKCIEVRPNDAGGFDELLMYGDDGEMLVHAEMMSDGCLWIGLYPPDEPARRVVMWINTKGKLSVKAEED